MSFFQPFSEYRRDIDGLRALAVVSVVLFHAGVAGFGGGYVGVDIFFVISGYLVARQILPGLYGGGFSFADFYAGRARRIVPALAAVVLITLAASFYLLMPDEFADVGKAAKSVAYFFSNHYFYGLENDYWDQFALAVQPLLHTWSLSAGVQYYLVFPLLLVLLLRVGRRRETGRSHTASPPPMWVVRSVLGGLTLVLFAVGDSMAHRDPAAAFYLLPARVWELLFGSIIASLAGSRLSRPPLWLAEICSIVGLICMLWGLLTYGQTTPFPGTHALVPVAGAGLMLYAGYSRTPTWMTRLLSLRGLAFIGVISYSLFLWHWPLWVLTRSTVWSVQGWPEIPVLGYLVLTLGVACVSWLLFERPFQARCVAAIRPSVVLCVALVGLIACFGAGLRSIHASRNDQQSLPPVLTQLDRDTSIAPGIDCEGLPELDAIRAGRSGCDLGGPAASGTAPDFILLGDSHARMWVSAFDALSRELKLHGVAMAYANCPPLRGAMPGARPECRGIMDAALDYVAQSPVKQVILVGNWTEAAATAFVPPATVAAPEPADLAGQPSPVLAPAVAPAFSNSLRDTIRYLQQSGKAVTFILDVPHLENDDVPRDLALLSVSQQGADEYGPSLAEHMAAQAPVVNSIEAIWPDLKPFGIVDPAIELCATGKCLVARGGRTWYRNKHQLTDDAARALRAAFLPLLRSVSAPR